MPNSQPDCPIAQATINDHLGLSQVIERCLREVNAHYYPPEIIERLLAVHSLGNLASFLSNKFTLVAKERGVIVGTGSLDGSEITTVFVSPSAHGRGIGRRIMLALEAEALQRGLAFVEIHATPNALKFYEELGYQHIEEVDRPGWGVSYHMQKVVNA